MIRCDFHNHSSASDGQNSPAEVVKIAFKNDVEYLALTDHDTVSGLEEAMEEAKKLNIKFVPGIELSTEYNNASVHVLGYFTDESYKDENLLEFLQNLKDKRIIRAYEIIERLKKYNNIELDINEVLKNGKDTIARPHIAKAIIDAGYSYDNEYIFEHIIGDNCPAYVPSTKMTTEDGVKLLKEYNALTFLAHPVFVKKTSLEDLIQVGFDGIEALYYQNTSKDTKRFIKLAKDNNLFVSCGSDYHGICNDGKHGNIGDTLLPENIDISKEISWIEKLAK